MTNPMKDSGVEWIGEIPESWEVKRLKFITKGSLQYGANAEGIDFDENLPRYIRITDIDSDNNLKISGKQSLPFNIAKPYFLKKGDLLFARSGATVGKTYLFQSDTLSAFAGYLIKYSPIENVESRFIYYMTLGNGYDNWKNSIFSQSTIQNIGADKYGNLPVALPYNKMEQQAIANFLDEQTKKLADAKDLLQKQIEKLKEYRNSIIRETVTKGLDKSVPMKDSGVEWIGEIPERWGVTKFKFALSTWKGLSITKANLVEEGIPVISYGQIHSKFGKQVKSTYELPLVPESYLSQKSALLKQGDFIYADTSEDIEGSGNFTTKLDDGLLFAGYHTIIARLNKNTEIEYSYLKHLFDSEWFRDQIRKTVSGVKVYSITQSIIANTSILVPPLQEQQAIANFLDEKTLIIKEVISNIQSQITVIDKQKQTLIYDYVTGKKGVKQ